jgi:hypothetical protein
LKPVLIIAIVAVAMIGVMVPSVFAWQEDFSDIEIVISDVKITENEYYDLISYTVTMKKDMKVYDKDVLIWLEAINTNITHDDGTGMNYHHNSEDIECPSLFYDHLEGDKGGIYSYKICTKVEKDYDEFFVVLDYSRIPGVRDKEGATFEERNKIIERFSKDNGMFGTTVAQSQVEVPIQESSEEGGGCLIATATYGSELAPQVQQLRELRDNQLLQTESGTAFMGTFNDIYYTFSPIIADYERENPLFKEAVKLAITPMISSLSLMDNANSESEVLGIGISVIALNIGMYLGVPAIVVIGIRKKF